MEGKDLVFYDGDCGFCQASIDWLLRHMEESRIEFTSYQNYSDPDAQKEFPQIDWGHQDKGVQALTQQGVTLKDEAVIAMCLKQVPKWEWLSKLMIFPLLRPFTHLGYILVARNRRRISRWLGLNACALPSRS